MNVQKVRTNVLTRLLSSYRDITTRTSKDNLKATSLTGIKKPYNTEQLTIRTITTF